MSQKAWRMIDVCPSCDSPKITARETKTPDYRCDICQERFDEPTTRRSKNYQHKAKSGGPDADDWQAVLQALRQTRDDGSSHARSKLIAKHAPELTSEKVGQLLSRYGEGDVVERYREASLGIVWRITVGEDDSRTEATYDA